jgi:hypothetical protein
LSKQQGLGEVVLSLFSPVSPIESRRALLGRERELRDIVLAISSTDRAVPVVTGPPGMGKSSVLLTVGGMLFQDTGAADFEALLGALKRVAVYCRCDPDLSGPADLARKINETLDEAVMSGNKTRHDISRSYHVEASIPFVRLSSDWTFNAPSTPAVSEEDGLVRRLRQLRRDGVDEVVILLDECEQLPWLTSVLAYIRRLDGMGCRFLLGVRDHVAYSIADPSQGDYRWPTFVPLEKFSREEVRGVFRRAQLILSQFGVRWEVLPEVITDIYGNSGGQPWYVQMVGSELIKDPTKPIERLLMDGVASRDTAQTFRSDIRSFERAEQAVRRKHLSGLHAGSYDRMCGRSAAREEFLRTMAFYPHTLIPYEFVRWIAKGRVEGAVRMLNDLCRSGVLVRNEAAQSVEFANHQLRVYCRLRRSLHQGIDEFASATVSNFVGNDA